jgi:hypothetical protein
MASSGSYDSFMQNLKSIRYSEGDVRFTKRNHYSIDWIANNQFMTDVTRQFPHRTYSKIVDYLETKGILEYAGPKSPRQITHVPRANARESFAMLETGDVLFFTTNKPHLDVAHVGIAKQGNRPELIHASSVAGKIVSQDLKEYFDNVRSYAGFIVVRPK